MGWFLIVAFLLLLFPNGRLPSPRWRPVLWGAVGYVGFFTVVIWLSPVSNDTRLAFVRNPLRLEIEIINFLLELLYLTIPLLLVAGAAAVIVRFRRSGGAERQQLKWFAYAVAVMFILFVLWFSLALAGLVVADALVFTVPLLGLPIAVGVAILRYHLYDIDLLVNRTLVYGSLTALLAATYLGGVVLMQGDVSGAHWAGVAIGHRRFDALDRGAVRPFAPPGSIFHRPPLLSPQVRRGPHAPGFLQQAA
jgi:hypothetical protein